MTTCCSYGLDPAIWRGLLEPILPPRPLPLTRNFYEISDLGSLLR